LKPETLPPYNYKEVDMTELDLAYLAGFIDGEGSIGIVVVAKHKKYVTQIAACNCNPTPIMLLKELFGGKIRLRNWKNKKWKPNYEWKLTAKKAAVVIKAILPYLKIKNKQAEIVLRSQQLKGKYTAGMMRWHPELKVARDAELQLLKEECNKLNKRGTGYEPDIDGKSN
jgi:hypothetical protein